MLLGVNMTAVTMLHSRNTEILLLRLQGNLVLKMHLVHPCPMLSCISQSYMNLNE